MEEGLRKFAAFVEEGCSPILDGNLEVLKSPIGDGELSRDYCMKFANKQKVLPTFLVELGDAQVSHYLLRWCVNGSRMKRLARTTPPTETIEAAQAFDIGVREAFAAACAVALSEQQSRRVSFPLRDGGVGLRPIGNRADAAYIASTAVTHKLCEPIWEGYGGSESSRDSALQEAAGSISLRTPACWRAT